MINPAEQPLERDHAARDPERERTARQRAAWNGPPPLEHSKLAERSGHRRCRSARCAPVLFSMPMQHPGRPRSGRTVRSVPSAVCSVSALISATRLAAVVKRGQLRLDVFKNSPRHHEELECGIDDQCAALIACTPPVTSGSPPVILPRLWDRSPTPSSRRKRARRPVTIGRRSRMPLPDLRTRGSALACGTAPPGRPRQHGGASGCAG